MAVKDPLWGAVGMRVGLGTQGPEEPGVSGGPRSGGRNPQSLHQDPAGTRATSTAGSQGVLVTTLTLAQHLPSTKHILKV